MRFINLRSQFNIIKRFCHHNNISEHIPKNVHEIKDYVSQINPKIYNIDAKLHDIDNNLKNINHFVFIIFCLNGIYIPTIVYLYLI
jgi:hypothetical protein